MTSLILAVVLQAPAKPFDPVGRWRAQSTLIVSAIEPGTPDSIKNAIKDSVKEQNAKPAVLEVRKDRTYKLPQEEGTWRVQGRSLILVLTKQGRMKVNGQRRTLAITPTGALIEQVNKMIRVTYTRIKLSRV